MFTIVCYMIGLIQGAQKPVDCVDVTSSSQQQKAQSSLDPFFSPIARGLKIVAV